MAVAGHRLIENITKILSASRPQVGLVCSSGDELLLTVDVVRRAGERCDRLAICASIGLAGRGMSAISMRSAFKCRVVDPREAPDQPDWGLRSTLDGSTGPNTWHQALTTAAD